MVLLYAESKDRAGLKYAAKPIASLAFIMVAVVGGGLSGPSREYVIWVVVGLVFGAGGDVALMLPQKRAFLIGLISFLIGHVAYIVACAILLAPGRWLSVHALAVVAVAAAVLVYLWPHLGKMKVPVIFYVLTISTMVVAATSVLRAGADDRGGASDELALLLALGAVFFFASDLAVARQRFVAPGFSNRAWGLPAYYGGQLLVAWSTIV